jgi:hypothetical protein
MYQDKELREYRDLLTPPSHFEEGFGWKTVIGAIFIGFLMMPGSMYLQLVIGQGIGPAARWVTIILFAEVAKRSYTELKQQEIFLLYYMAGAALASPFQGLLWNQYLVQSDAARMLGLTEFIPDWVAPQPGSGSLLERTFLHRDWLIPILLLTGAQLIQRIDHFGLGYALYRVTSDVEKLPFPMAPVGALGTMALAESAEDRKTGWKWRIFSIGGVIGLGFGTVYVLLPALSGLLLAEPVRLIPIPWIELTPYTENALPAFRRHGAAVLGGHRRTGRTGDHHGGKPPAVRTRHTAPLARRHGHGGNGVCQQLRLLHELRHRAGAFHRRHRHMAGGTFFCPQRQQA